GDAYLAYAHLSPQPPCGPRPSTLSFPSFAFFFFFFTATATSHLYTLSLHDALPISGASVFDGVRPPKYVPPFAWGGVGGSRMSRDRKSTRLNSSHVSISYAVFCLKKNKPVQEAVCFWHVVLRVRQIDVS